MTLTLMRIGLLDLLRDKVALGLTFVLPIVFYSIFAIVFGTGGSNGMSGIRIVIVDEDGSEASARLVDSLATESAVRVVSKRAEEGQDPEPWTRAKAEALVADSEVPVAVILPEGFGESLGAIFGGDSGAPIDLLVDVADPIAGNMVMGLLQKSAFASMPDIMLEQGMDAFQQYGGPLTGTQRAAVASLRMLMNDSGDSAEGGDDAASDDGAPTFSGPISVNVVDVMAQGDENKNAGISFYAAGTGVMFLLFSAAGAGGSLLDEQDNGTLERVLSSRVSMTTLLTAKWLLVGAIGFIQVSMMFIWGWLVFGLELWTGQILAGFTLMTLATAAAASAFGLLLATLCRSRAQLGGMSTIVILIMSAIGGSMFPRFMMPEAMQQVGLVTFNAWALDGYRKVFWNGVSPVELWPQLGVMVGLTVLLLLGARLLARRWERQ